MIYVPCLWREQLTASNGERRWPSGLRRGSAAARLLGSGVRIPPGAWLSFSGGCYVLYGRGLLVGLIIRPKESYRVWCVCACVCV